MSTSSPLSPALDGSLRTFQNRHGHRVAYYKSRDNIVMSANLRPLVLIHSINAAASAYELRPVFEHFSCSRPTYVLEWPGFGQSQRGKLHYSAQLYMDTLIDFLLLITGDYPAVDLVALDGAAAPEAFLRLGVPVATVEVTPANSTLVQGDSLQLTARLRDAQGNETRFSTDTLGRTTGQTDPLGYNSTSQYNALDQLTQATDALNQTSALNYDAAARLTGVVNQAGVTIEGYGYDTTKAEMLPTSLTAALDALEADTAFAEVLGDTFVRTFVAYKRDEIERFNAWITDWEFHEYTYHL